MNFLDRIRRGWNAFTNNRDPTFSKNSFYGNWFNPNRHKLTYESERTILNSILNRISLDCASIQIKHCELDSKGRYVSDVNSGLNKCLNRKANIDQTGAAFIQDVVMSMLDEGVVAIVPVDIEVENIDGKVVADILSLRTGKILQWFPSEVQLSVYNEKKGDREEIILPKDEVAIVENPLYSVMNEPNSTIQRLKRKLNLLDMADEDSASGKLDLIIQLPYAIRSEARRKEAELRRKEMETQLAESKYGVAYADVTEKVIQLNRSVDNNLMNQIEYLTNLSFSQLGITQGILDGTADEKTMLNYYSRIIDPILSEIVNAMYNTFMSTESINNNESIVYFRDPFKLVPVNNIAEIADKFTRNEIMTSNEIRQVIGMKPADDPKADMLVNSNINQSKEEAHVPINKEEKNE